MKKLISSGRLIGGGIVLALLLVLYFSVLFKLQVIEGAKYAAESANNRVTEETVAASRAMTSSSTPTSCSNRKTPTRSSWN